MSSGLRIGLIGAGRIGMFHAQTLRKNSAVRELVIADIDPLRAQTAALKHTAAYALLDTLFSGRVDAVVVAAATSAHAQLVSRAVAEKLPVFCEKPLASDVSSTLRVLDEVAASGSSLVMGFQRRADAGYRAAREAVRSGRVGWLHSLHATTFDPAPPPAEYIPTSGGLFRDCLIHDFDIIRFVTGREVTAVYATGSNKGADFFAAAGDVDTGVALLTLDDGTLAAVQGGRYNGCGYDVRLELHGSAQTVVVGLDDRVPLVSTEPDALWPLATPYATFFQRFHDAYVTEINDFVAHVLGRIPNPSPPHDALEALYVAEAAEASRAAGRPVQVADVRNGAGPPRSAASAKG